MADTQPMQADGGAASAQGSSDGVGDAATHGREEGESQGGAYPNPHRGKKPQGGDFLHHGGQTEIAYHGGPNPNATTKD